MPLAPLKVICGPGVTPWHTVVVPVMVAVGNGFTIIVALPVCVWSQDGLALSWTLTKL